VPDQSQPETEEKEKGESGMVCGSSMQSVSALATIEVINSWCGYADTEWLYNGYAIRKKGLVVVLFFTPRELQENISY